MNDREPRIACALEVLNGSLDDRLQRARERPDPCVLGNLTGGVEGDDRRDLHQAADHRRPFRDASGANCMREIGDRSIESLTLPNPLQIRHDRVCIGACPHQLDGSKDQHEQATRKRFARVEDLDRRPDGNREAAGESRSLTLTVPESSPENERQTISLRAAT